MIRFHNVRKQLGGRPVLDGVSFDIQKGEIFVIVGPSGAGKSVTLKHMVKFMTPDEGDVLVGGESVGEARGLALERIRARFGYLFQGAALMAWLTVEENVALPLREKTSMAPDAIRDKVFETLKMVGMENDAGKMPAEISGGMRKRTGLARAIVRNPEIVLYDEPTSGLDPVSSRSIDELIVRLREETGSTSVMVTHDLHSALAIGTRIAVLYGGRIVELSAPADFIHSENSEVRAFLESQFITTRGPWEKELR